MQLLMMIIMMMMIMIMMIMIMMMLVMIPMMMNNNSYNNNTDSNNHDLLNTTFNMKQSSASANAYVQQACVRSSRSCDPPTTLPSASSIIPPRI